MPAVVSLLALLSLAPLVVLAAGAIGSVSFVADRMLVALVDYVAVLLAFVGGTHWGLGLWPGSGRSPMRLTVAVLPMLVGWIALVTAQFVSSAAALIVLIAGTLVTMLTEHQARRHQAGRHQAGRHDPALQPGLWLRWSFAGVVMGTLMLVLLLRGVGL
jgi:hypothetical protein